MNNNYVHLLSPIKVRNTVLRNRLHAPPSRPHFVQGPEHYPSENIITHWANKAKSGAAIVTCNGAMSLGKPMSTHGLTGIDSKTMMGHFFNFDIYDSLVQHYISQLSDTIHFYGAKASMMIGSGDFSEYDVNDDVPPTIVEGDRGGGVECERVGVVTERIVEIDGTQTDRHLVVGTDDRAGRCIVIVGGDMDVIGEEGFQRHASGALQQIVPAQEQPASAVQVCT